ncbi:hypothetical protein BGX31_008515 [Mortierella sp. GBA43]|nr:hypothetical protein BGX31_008515 [Mortierella sp. GBA43]
MSPTLTYTPPPPEGPSDSSRSVLRTINFPASATPLPPTTPDEAPMTGHSNAPQIRYCYFISANSTAPGNTRNPSLTRKTVYLTPHIQEPTDGSPNCTQPRSRPSKDTTPSQLVLGPHPPQIQLQFLEDEPLPAPTLSEPQPLAELSRRAVSSDGALVERKDSGYGGSVTRSSSLAAFGRGIRKVFWRSSSKEEVESIVGAEPPVLNCEIPQDVSDNSNWAEDLAHRLTLASGDEAVTAWLGQLPVDSVHHHDLDNYDSESELDMIEEVVFVIPQGFDKMSSTLPRSVSETSIRLSPDFGMSVLNSEPVQQPSRKSLRKVLSVEELNKPQPLLPLEAFNHKPVPSVPAQSRSTIGGSSPFNSLARKLNVGEFSFGKNSSTKSRRPNVHDIFQDSSADSMLSPHSRPSHRSGESIEILDGSRSRPGTPMTMTPDEVEGSSYLTAKPTSKRSNRFFKSLTMLTATELKRQHDSDVAPSSELFISNQSPDHVAQSSDPQSPTSPLRQDKRRSGSYPLAPPRPLFYNKGVSSSVSSLGQVSSCGSLDSSAIDSSADEWDGHARMTIHAREQNDRYISDLVDLQTMLFQNSSRGFYSSSHSANTSTGSLSLSLNLSFTEKKETKPAKPVSKKDDYMSHRMSSCASKQHPAVSKAKAKIKSRLSMAYGGGEVEVVKPAKFDTPQAIARNKEIRKFISQEIYTTELNYLQYLRTIQEVFVQPLFKSLETDKPFIPKSNPLYQLLAHIPELIEVAADLAQRLEDCVRDEVWSDETSLVGTIFLDAKDPLTIFLRYGQSYGKGMKALRTLMKSKRASLAASTAMTAALGLTPIPATSTVSSPPTTKRSSGSGQADSSKNTASMKPRSSHGTLTAGEISDFDLFLRNCAGDKETTSRFTLADLLILPIQRVTRYCLLLKDLKRHTDVAHQDYVCIVHALEQLHTLALATNNVQPSSMRF